MVPQGRQPPVHYLLGLGQLAGLQPIQQQLDGQVHHHAETRCSPPSTGGTSCVTIYVLIRSRVALSFKVCQSLRASVTPDQISTATFFSIYKVSMPPTDTITSIIASYRQIPAVAVPNWPIVGVTPPQKGKSPKIFVRNWSKKGAKTSVLWQKILFFLGGSFSQRNWRVPPPPLTEKKSAK